MKNVNIDVSSTDDACAFDVDGNATLNLTLEGNNTLKSGLYRAGLQVEDGASVNIMGGSGDTLNATGGEYGAGIGGGESFVGNIGAGGDITISGGNVIATGGSNAAGIGSGGGAAAGTITIDGGNVSATGGRDGAGIGSGTKGAGGTITISGGNVTAAGGSTGAGIGGGYMGTGGNITISGGNVAATGGEMASGIGGGRRGDAGTFSTGTNGSATITATGGAGDVYVPAGSDIADTSGQANWSGTINGVTYGSGTFSLNRSLGSGTFSLNRSSGGTGGNAGGNVGGNAGTGSAQNSWWIQAGAEAGVGIEIQIGAMNTEVLGIQKDTVNILTQDSSGDAITAVSGAIEKLSEQRSRLGAYQNRLEHTIRNLDNVVENTTAAESQIRDADMANLMVKHANNNIIMQAAQAMLAQANHQPEGILQLLQ